MKVITVCNRKGGVAKTTTTVSLGHGLALQGKTVLLVDVDPQGHIAPALNLEQEPGLFSLLVAGASLRNVIKLARPGLWVLPGNQRTDTAQKVLVAEDAKIDTLGKAIRGPVNGSGPDFIILDTAPSVGRLQEMALFMADLVLIPSACDFLSTKGIGDLVTDLDALRRDKGWKGAILGILPTFYDDRTNESKANKAELEASFGDLVLPPLHRATVLRECAAEGVTIFEKDPASRAAEEYRALIERVLEHGKKKGSFGRG